MSLMDIWVVIRSTRKRHVHSCSVLAVKVFLSIPRAKNFRYTAYASETRGQIIEMEPSPGGAKVGGSAAPETSNSGGGGGGGGLVGPRAVVAIPGAWLGEDICGTTSMQRWDSDGSPKSCWTFAWARADTVCDLMDNHPLTISMERISFTRAGFQVST